MNSTNLRKISKNKIRYRRPDRFMRRRIFFRFRRLAKRFARSRIKRNKLLQNYQKLRFYNFFSQDNLRKKIKLKKNFAKKKKKVIKKNRFMIVKKYKEKFNLIKQLLNSKKFNDKCCSKLTNALMKSGKKSKVAIALQKAIYLLSKVFLVSFRAARNIIEKAIIYIKPAMRIQRRKKRGREILRLVFANRNYQLRKGIFFFCNGIKQRNKKMRTPLFLNIFFELLYLLLGIHHKSFAYNESKVYLRDLFKKNINIK